MAPIAANTTIPAMSGTMPTDRNQPRFPTSVSTAALKPANLGAIVERSSSISPRNWDRCRLLPSRTWSTTDVTDFSHGVRSTGLPAESSRSATLSWRRPPHTLRSVVTCWAA